jgi:thiamine biosynthesis protein ThiS
MNGLMKIHVNGQEKETSVTTVGSLLQELQLLPTQVAIEYNGTVLFRHEFGTIPVKEGDQIEIVRVVAGG